MTDLNSMSIQDLENEKKRLLLEQEVEKLRGAKGWTEPEDRSLEGNLKRFRSIKEIEKSQQESILAKEAKKKKQTAENILKEQEQERVWREQQQQQQSSR